MPEDFNSFTRDEVHAIIKKQGTVSRAMAKYIAERTGRSERNIIAAAVAMGNFNEASRETNEQARTRFVLAQDGSERFGLSKWSQQVIALAAGLLVAGLLVRCAMEYGSTANSPQQTNARYARCEAELKPKLNKCLQGPQSTWEACGQAYMSDLEACTSD